MTKQTLEPVSKSSNLNAWVKRHQIISFVLLAFLFSYLIGGAFNVFTAQWSFPGIISIYLPRLLFVIGPSFGAVTVSFLSHGKPGVRNLFQKLIPRKKDIGWFLLLPIIGTVVNILSFLMAGLSINRLWDIFTDGCLLLVLHLMIQLLFIGIGEELGWRGWLLPKLTDKYSLTVSMLIIFIVWGTWHVPILFMGADVVVPWMFVIIAATILLTWIWIQLKGNLFVVAIAHASINSSQFFMESQIGKAETQLLLDSWRINGYLYLLMGMVFLFFMRKNLIKSYPPETT
ncbi:hypothetical protein C3K47_12315 [Solitalea longa]|uniref:CAAX prenyl protease 2/Lysostaphin resistance protein A-like domain-containing protein n=1 Tax=Solitalea longa TaxID=2079460 RepID=A0A2S5A1I9_9SPHI|nr:type II CAAX endopeptidase family protein [Solitalea longa]POY35983.1 hypothetical protein C3K47_12315 [Solitalea longa]